MNYINHISILLILASTSVVFAQVEFAPIGARWYINDAYSSVDEDNPLRSFYTLESQGDRIIDGVDYRVVGEWLFHQDVDKVYYLWMDTMRLIYDFGVDLGDTVSFEMITCGGDDIQETTFEVVDIDLILLGSTELKQVKCEVIEGSFSGILSPYTYIEQIGSTRKIVEDLAGCQFTPETEPERLRCYSYNGDEYKTDWYRSFGDLDCDLLTSTENLNGQENKNIIYPNPSSGVLNLNIEADYVEITSIDQNFIKRYQVEANGRVNCSEINSGIYILIAYNRKGGVIGFQRIIIK